MNKLVERELRAVIELYEAGGNSKLLAPFKTLADYYPETLLLQALSETIYTIGAVPIKYPVLLKNTMGRLFDLLTLQLCEETLDAKEWKNFAGMAIHSTKTTWGLAGVRRLLENHVGDTKQPRVLRPLLTKKFNKRMGEVIQEADKLKGMAADTLHLVINNNPAYFSEGCCYVQGLKRSTVGIVGTFSRAKGPASMFAEPIPASLQDLDIEINEGSVLDASLGVISNYKYTLDPELCTALLTYLGYERHFSTQLGVNEGDNKAAFANTKLALTEGIAEWYRLEDKAFFSGFRVDHRGRLYQKGFISAVTSAPCKALLRAAQGEKLGSNGLRALHIGVAGVLGHDKKSFEVREQIGRDAQESLANLVDVLRLDARMGWQKLAEVGSDDVFALASYALTFKRLAEFEGAVEDFECNLFVEIDGTNSGLQHYSCLSRSYDLAKASNICRDESSIDGAEDCYKALGDEMITVGGEDSYFASLEASLQRKICKKLLMTRLYGATNFGMTDDVLAIMKEYKKGEADLWKKTKGIISLFLLTMETGERFTLINAVQKFFRESAKAFLNNGEHYRYQVPGIMGYKPQEINFKAYKQEGIKLKLHITSASKATVRYFNTDISTHTRKEAEIDRGKEMRASAPSTIHAYDALYLQALTLKLADTITLLTHDCIGVLPNHFDRLRSAVKEVWAEMYEMDNLARMQEETLLATGTLVELPELGDTKKLLDGIEQSLYSFC